VQQSSVNSKFTFLADEYEAAKLRWAGGAERPNWRGNEPKKTGARSARARTRGQNPLVYYMYLPLYKCFRTSSHYKSKYFLTVNKMLELLGKFTCGFTVYHLNVHYKEEVTLLSLQILVFML